jgi:hypothetical protein
MTLHAESQPVKKWFIVLAFGLAALVVVLAGLIVPIPGSEVATDPRELFATLGSALSGPVGGAVIGFLAGVAAPGYPLASVLAHIVGCVWIGGIYKYGLYRYVRTPLPLFLLGWVVAVALYYLLFLIPSFVLGVALFYGDASPLLPFYGRIVRGAFIEIVLTALITTVAMAALPGKYRRPR